MNSKFSYENLEINDVKLITPFYMEDDRGYFLKSIEKDIFYEWGIDVDVFETFETYSKQGVIRGMHFQTNNPQAKIVRVLKGEVRDVIVDLRKGSGTFGKHIVVSLSDSNRKIIWIPKGFAHGFEVISKDAIVSYTCVGKYMNQFDTGILWNDPTLGIEWKTDNPIVSEKDRCLQTFLSFRDKFGGLKND